MHPDSSDGPHPPDDALLRGLRAGDARSLELLLQRYWAPLVAYADRLLGGYEDAEDRVQEAFARLWVRRLEVREEGSIRALLYTILRNATLDELRRRRRREESEREGPPPHRPATPWEDVHGAELERVAAEAVERLPSRRREVFRLVREEGLTYREVAEILDLSPQTVANHMSLAMADLRTALRPHLLHGLEGEGTEDRHRQHPHRHGTGDDPPR